MAHRSPARLTAREGRSFAFTLTGAFTLLAAVSWWRGHTRSFEALAAVAGVLLLAGVAVPSRLGPVRDGWMALARAISKVTTPIIMTLVYFLVITPSALLRRVIGGNPLRRSHGAPTGWVGRRGSPRSALTRQF